MTFSSEVITILDDLAKRFGVALDWSNQNVMPYLEDLVSRFIKWEITTSIVWLVAASILFIGGVILMIYFIKLAIREYEEEMIPVIAILCSIVLIPLLAVVMVQIFDIIKCINLPELVIYNYITDHLG